MIIIPHRFKKETPSIWFFCSLFPPFFVCVCGSRVPFHRQFPYLKFCCFHFRIDSLFLVHVSFKLNCSVKEKEMLQILFISRLRCIRDDSFLASLNYVTPRRFTAAPFNCVTRLPLVKKTKRKFNLKILVALLIKNRVKQESHWVQPSWHTCPSNRPFLSSVWSQSFVNCTIIHAWKETWLECPPSSPPNFPFNHLHTHTHTLTQKETLFKFDNPQNWIVLTFSSLSCVFSISLLLLLFFFFIFQLFPFIFYLLTRFFLYV